MINDQRSINRYPAFASPLSIGPPPWIAMSRYASAEAPLLVKFVMLCIFLVVYTPRSILPAQAE
jgi:hypothetical protein